MKQGQETNQIWTHEAGTHDAHNRTLTYLPPPGRRVPSRNSSTGEGVGALEAPQDKHGQEHRTGTSRAEQTDKGGHGGAGSSGGHGVARGSGGHGSAGSSGGHGRWSLWPWPRSPRPGPYSRNPFTPPKNFPGDVRGYQEPSGAKQTGQTGQGSPPGPDRQDSTKQERPPGPDRQDSPQEPEALLGWLGG